MQWQYGRPRERTKRSNRHSPMSCMVAAYEWERMQWGFEDVPASFESDPKHSRDGNPRKSGECTGSKRKRSSTDSEEEGYKRMRGWRRTDHGRDYARSQEWSSLRCIAGETTPSDPSRLIQVC